MLMKKARLTLSALRMSNNYDGDEERQLIAFNSFIHRMKVEEEKDEMRERRVQ